MLTTKSTNVLLNTCEHNGAGSLLQAFWCEAALIAFQDGGFGRKVSMLRDRFVLYLKITWW